MGQKTHSMYRLAFNRPAILTGAILVPSSRKANQPITVFLLRKFSNANCLGRPLLSSLYFINGQGNLLKGIDNKIVRR